MIRRLDQIAAVLVSLIGLVHLVVGREAFFNPTERGVWFASAGFLLVTTGLANLACAEGRSTRLQALTALSGSLAILASGGMLAVADPDLLFAPQTLVLVGVGVLLALLRLRDLSRRGG